MTSHLFSNTSHATLYAKFRPSPPKELISTIINYLCEHFDSSQLKRAVDVGCGSGQSTKLLAPHFSEVFGLDVSDAQIDKANELNDLPNVCYRVSTAEDTRFETSSVELVSVSQAFHWFDSNQFYAECDRILTPRGVLALFGYRMPYVSHHKLPNDRTIAGLVNQYYSSPLLCWNRNERQLVDSGYASVNLPFRDFVRYDCFESHSSASALELKGYITTWSGFNELRVKDEETAKLFLSNYDETIKQIFGPIDTNKIEFQIHYNFFLLMARKS